MKYIRYRSEGKGYFGELEEDVVYELDGDYIHGAERTGRSMARGEVELLGPSDFICNQRGFLLRPVVGVVSPAGLARMRPSPAEVAETFTVPLDFFRRTPPVTARYELTPSLPEDFPYEAAGIPRDYVWSRGAVEVPSWRYEGHVIWGMTARIVKDLIQNL